MDDVRWLRRSDEAERVVARWMRTLGFNQVFVTGLGDDSGVDIVSDEAVAQVEATIGATDLTALQAFVGLASTEAKTPIFFASGGYTRRALAWADYAQLPLLSITSTGDVYEFNAAAELLVERKTDTSKSLSSASGMPQIGRGLFDGDPFSIPCNGDNILVYGVDSSSTLYRAPHSVLSAVIDAYSLARNRQVEISKLLHQFSDPSDTIPPFVSASNTDLLIASMSQRRLAKVDPISYNVAWDATTECLPDSPPIRFDHYVLCKCSVASPSSQVGEFVHGMMAFSAEGGAHLWTIALPYEIAHCDLEFICASAGTAVIAFHNSRHRIVDWNKAAESGHAQYDAQSPWFGSLVGIDLRTGRLKWERDDVYVQVMASGEHATIVFEVTPEPFERCLRWIDSTTGSEVCSASFGGDRRYMRASVGASGGLMAFACGSVVAVYDERSDEPIWWCDNVDGRSVRFAVIGIEDDVMFVRYGVTDAHGREIDAVVQSRNLRTGAVIDERNIHGLGRSAEGDWYIGERYIGCASWAVRRG